MVDELPCSNVVGVLQMVEDFLGLKLSYVLSTLAIETSATHVEMVIDKIQMFSKPKDLLEESPTIMF